MSAFLAGAVRPFVYLLIWGIASGLAIALRRNIPEGRIKDALYKQRK